MARSQLCLTSYLHVRLAWFSPLQENQARQLCIQPQNGKSSSSCRELAAATGVGWMTA